MLKIRRRHISSSFQNTTQEARTSLLNWAIQPLEYRRQRRAPIDHDIFRNTRIVDEVAKDFHDRCAFCEVEIGISEGVSHFRPLSLAYDKHEPYEDFYTWLAFEWLNIFLICRRCQVAKGEIFPLVDGHRARYLSTLDEVRSKEKSLLIDPTRDNPADYISYLINGECYPKSNSPKSIATINILKLNNQDLVFARREAIDKCLERLMESIRSNTPFYHEYLSYGSFVGACRDVLLRIISVYQEHNLSINNEPAITRRVNEIIRTSNFNDVERLRQAIEIIKSHDQLKRDGFSLEGFRDISVQLDLPRLGEAEKVMPSRANDELKSIKISNFRAIDNLTIDFPKVRQGKAGAPCLLLLGENATGKSSCLLAIALALIGVKQARKLKLPFHEYARSSSRNTWNLWGDNTTEVSVSFHYYEESAIFRYDKLHGRIDGNHEPSMIVLGYGPHRYFTSTYARQRNDPADRIRSLFDPRRPLPDPSEWLRNLSDRQFNQVTRTIRTILPTGDDDQLINHREYGLCISVQGQLTPVSQLSEGYRSVFAMVTDICRTLLDYWDDIEIAQAVVLIDEIETHLHPRWKMKVISSFRRAFPRVQFIVTTHDPLCIRGMDDNEVVVFTRNENGELNVLEDLPNVSGMRAEQLLTSEYFGLSSTIDPEVHLKIAQLSNSERYAEYLGEEASDLVAKLTLGNTAAAQIVHEALTKYLHELEKPLGSISVDAREEAVAAVFKALKSSTG